jgi:hypothetical protein
MKMSKIKIVGPENDHKELVEVLSIYFKVLKEGRLRPANEGNNSFVGYYIVGEK